MLPLVYVETNWIVALALPHDRAHRQAAELLNDANAAQCEVRIPWACFREAAQRCDRAMQEAPGTLAEVRDKLGFALENGWSELAPALVALDSVAVSSYFRHQPGPLIDALRSNENVVQIDDPPNEAVKLAALRRDTKLGVDNTFDRYVLAAVLVDRAKVPADRRAVFCSMDQDLAPSKRTGALVPGSFYSRERIYYAGDFRWHEAVKAWRGKFP